MASEDVDINTCDDEEALTKLLGATEDFNKRKLIRNRLKLIRENESKAFNEKRKEQGPIKDFTAMRVAAADAERMRKLQDYQVQAKESSIGAACKEDYVAKMHERNVQEQQTQMRIYDEMAKEGGPGVIQDGLEMVKRIEHKANDEARQRELAQFEQFAKHVEAKSKVPVGDNQHVQQHDLGKQRQDKLSSDQMTPKIDVTGSLDSDDDDGKKGAPQGARGAMNAFKKMDKAANPEGTATKPNYLSLVPKIKRAGKEAKSSHEIKIDVMSFCQTIAKNYVHQGVKVTNFSGSWADGLAFCALIHNFYPDSFDFAKLDPKNREHNFKLAFDTAERCADIAPLLDVSDMVAMAKPDWKCVFTYVQSFYRRFRLDPRFNKTDEEKSAEEQPTESNDQPKTSNEAKEIAADA